jgi:hypothetical protein
MIQKEKEWELAKRWFCLDKSKNFDWESRGREQQEENRIGLPFRDECCGGEQFEIRANLQTIMIPHSRTDQHKSKQQPHEEKDCSE